MKKDTFSTKMVKRLRGWQLEKEMEKPPDKLEKADTVLYKVHALKRHMYIVLGSNRLLVAMCEKKIGSACACVLAHLTCSHFHPTAAI